MYTPRTENKIAARRLPAGRRLALLAEVGASNSERSRVQARTTGKYNVDTGAGTLQIQWIKNQHYDNRFGRVELKGRFGLGWFTTRPRSAIPSSERQANNPFGFGAVTTPINIYNPAPIAPLADPNKPESYAPSQNLRKEHLRLRQHQPRLVAQAAGRGAQVRRQLHQHQPEDASPGTRCIRSRPRRAPASCGKWRRATTLYGSYMRALEDGPTATAGTVNEFQILAPTESVQKEIGVRTEYIKGVNLNVDYFDIVRANAVANQVAGRALQRIPVRRHQPPARIRNRRQRQAGPRMVGQRAPRS